MSSERPPPSTADVQAIEELQRAALKIVGNALRSSTLMGSANLQHVQLGLMHWLEGLVGLPRGAPLDATMFYEFLLKQGVAKESAHEVILMLRSMEDRLGFSIGLPADVEKLSETKKQIILQKYQQRSRGPTFVHAPTPAPGAPTGPEAPARDAFKKAKGSPRGVALAIFGVVAIGGVYALRFFEETSPPLANVDVTFPADAFACQEVHAVQKTLMCKIKLVEWDAMPEHERKRRLESAVEFTKKSGYRQFYVVTIEDNQIRAGY